MWTKKGVTLICAAAAFMIGGTVLNHYLLVAYSCALFSFITLTTLTMKRLVAIPYRVHPEEKRAKAVDVQISRSLSSERIVEDGEIDVKLTLINKKGSGFVEIRDKLPNVVKLKKGSNNFMLNLSPGTETAINYTVECPLMGPHIIGPVSLRVEDVSGLCYIGEDVDIYSDFLVMPKIEEIKEVKIRSSVPKLYTGAVSIKQPGPGYEFYSLREYVPTDPLRNINWKAFVKTGKLMVNEREREAISDITIILDSRTNSNIGFISKNPLLYSARATAALVSYFLKRRDSVGLVVYDSAVHIVNHGTGETQLLKILTALAGVKAQGNLPLQAVVNVILPHIPPRSAIIVLSSLEDDDTVPKAARDIMANDFHLTILSMSPASIEHEAGKISKQSYEILNFERECLLSELSRYGARVIRWSPNVPVASALMEARIF